MRNITREDSASDVYWRLRFHFDRDPMMKMLTKEISNGIAEGFYNLIVGKDESITLDMTPENIKTTMRTTISLAPLGWCGDGFRIYVQDIAVAALLPEG